MRQALFGYNDTAGAKAFLDGYSSYDGTIEAYAEEVKTAYLLGKEAGERGIGPRALYAFMEYYRTHGEWRLILRTWSGNKRMLRCAEKLGFLEIKRESDTRFR